MTRVEPAADAGPTGTDRDAVVRRLSRRGLVTPRYDTAGLGSVMLAAAGVLGAEVVTRDGLSSARSRDKLGLPRADRVCVVLVDGLGLRLLTKRRGHAPTLRGLLDDARRLSAPFPSTTAASLGVLGTGTGPGRTGLLGYTIRSSRTRELANMLSWTGLPAPTDVQTEPTVLERLAERGTSVTSVGLARFEASGMTRAALRGATTYLAADSLASRVDAAARALRKPGFTYLYVGEVDKAGHHHGWRSGAWGDALSEVDRELGRLLRSVPRGTLVLITADHGMVDVDPQRRYDVAAEPALREGVAMVAGEPRATHVYVDEGADADVVAAVQERWQDVLGDDAVVLRRDEVLAAGLVGPVSEHVLPDLGDLVVAATGRATVVDSATQTPASMSLLGVHGSLTPDEMHVPLIAARA